MFVNGQSNALSGNVSVGSLDGGSSQNSTYYGAINVQAGYLTFGNGTTVQGDVSVTATGLIHASMTIYQTVIQGSVNVRSDIDSGVSLYSGSTINGSVQVTNTNALTDSVNNNVYIDSQSVINNSVTVTGLPAAQKVVPIISGQSRWSLTQVQEEFAALAVAPVHRALVCSIHSDIP